MLLPNLTPEGTKIMIYGPTTDDASLFQPSDFFRRMAMVLDIQQKAGIDFTGLRVLLYLRHATIAHLGQFDLPYLKKVFKIATVSALQSSPMLYISMDHFSFSIFMVSYFHVESISNSNETFAYTFCFWIY